MFKAIAMAKPSRASLKLSSLIAVSLLGLNACGGGSSKSSFEAPKVLSGVFKDSNVSGLAFESRGEKGITDEKGAFTYEDKRDVTFSIGGVEIGSGVGKAVMTPIDLVANGSLTNPEVVNKIRFLMMLDKDNKPSNGIQISEKVQEKAKTWTSVDFKGGVFPSENVQTIRNEATVEDGVAHSIPESDVAIAHLKTTLLCANAGAYAGSYTGTKSGKLALMVDPVTGEVRGSAYDPDAKVSSEVTSIVALDYDKKLDFQSSEASTGLFSGTVISTEVLSGTWRGINGFEVRSGDFSTTRIGGKSDAVYRYTASFNGDDKGIYTFDVDDSNNVTGTRYSVSTQKEEEVSGEISDSNKLTVTTNDGDELTGFIVEDTLAISGVWINDEKTSNGNFDGGGCRLN